MDVEDKNKMILHSAASTRLPPTVGWGFVVLHPAVWGPPTFLWVISHLCSVNKPNKLNGLSKLGFDKNVKWRTIDKDTWCEHPAYTHTLAHINALRNFLCHIDFGALLQAVCYQPHVQLGPFPFLQLVLFMQT